MLQWVTIVEICYESHIEEVAKCKVPYKTLGSSTSTTSFRGIVLLKTYARNKIFFVNK